MSIPGEIPKKFAPLSENPIPTDIRRAKSVSQRMRCIASTSWSTERGEMIRLSWVSRSIYGMPPTRVATMHNPDCDVVGAPFAPCGRNHVDSSTESRRSCRSSNYGLAGRCEPVREILTNASQTNRRRQEGAND